MYVVVFVSCPRISKLKYRHAYLSAEMHLRQGAACSFREKVSVGCAGGATHDHFQRSQTGTVIDELLADQFTFNRPDPVGQPIHHFSVVCDAAQQGHGGMPMCIDKTRCHQVTLKFQFRRGRKLCCGFCLWQQSDNAVTFYYQAMIEQ